jgi:hypothetical protein
MAMSQCKSKADWKHKLEEAGLMVPKDATIQYMKMIWAEAQQELKVKNLEGTLESELKALRAAGRKKSVLLDFMKDKGMVINPNSTIALLLASGEKEIYNQYEPTGCEKMNFGKYADHTFEEVFNLHPSYVNWIAATAQESDSVHWRLLRFHRWATQLRSKQKVTQALNPNVKGKASSTGSFSVLSEGEEITPAAQEIMEAWKKIQEQRDQLEAQAQELQKQKCDLDQEILANTKDRKTRREM